MAKYPRGKQYNESIRDREVFKNSTGSFRAVEQFEGAGRLPYGFSRTTLYTASYVVYSYQTPIAWVCRGRWYYPLTSYSPTTSTHQSSVRMGMTGKPLMMSQKSHVTRKRAA